MKRCIVLSLNLVIASSVYAMDCGGLTTSPGLLTPPASPEDSEISCAQIVTQRALEAYKSLLYREEELRELSELGREKGNAIFAQIAQKAEQISKSLTPLLFVLKYSNKESFKKFLKEIKALHLTAQLLKDDIDDSVMASFPIRLRECCQKLSFIACDKEDKVRLLRDKELPKLILHNVKAAEERKEHSYVTKNLDWRKKEHAIKEKLCI